MADRLNQWSVNWRSAIGEMLLIIVGVTIALAVDEWRQERNDQMSGGEYVDRLIRDLEFDIEIWGLVRDVTEQKMHALDRALEWHMNPQKPPEDQRQFLQDLVDGARLAYGAGTNVENATFEELINSGRLGLIRDGEARRELLLYYAYVDDDRIRVNSRITEFAPTVYKLIPRDPEFEVLAGLSDEQVDRIVDRSSDYDLEGLIIAERNRARFRREIAIESSERASQALGKLVQYQSKLQ